MTDKFFNAMGLARRAGRLAVGHDEAKAAVRSGRARLVVVAEDASARLFEEFTNISGSVPVMRIRASMDDMHRSVGKRSGVFAVCDGGFTALILSTIKEEATHGQG